MGEKKTTKKTSNTKKLICLCCGEEKNEKEFYKSSSLLYSKIGKIPTCKECISKIYDKYKIKYNKDERLAIYHMCRILDISFNQKCFDASVGERNNKRKETQLWQIYFTKMNSIGKKNGYGESFDDSDKLDINKSIEDNKKTKLKIIRKWGKGYTDEQYEMLEDIYKEWCGEDTDENLSLSEKKTYKMLTHKEMDIIMARERGDSTDKMEETYRKLMSDADATLKDIKNNKDESDKSKLWGIKTYDIENFSPAEYFKQKKLYEDYDGFIDYLNRFVFRPIKNLLMGTKEYDKEFTIEEDTDLFTDGDTNE